MCLRRGSEVVKRDRLKIGSFGFVGSIPTLSFIFADIAQLAVRSTVITKLLVIERSSVRPRVSAIYLHTNLQQTQVQFLARALYYEPE